MSSEQDTYFVVTYRNPEKPTENITIRVRSIQDSSLGLAFVSLSDFVFKSRSALLNPQDEYAKTRFQKTKNLHLSIYSILSVEEVGEDNDGLSLAHDKSKLLLFNPDK